MAKRKKSFASKKKLNNIFTKEIFGMALCLFTILSLLCLITGNDIFFDLGLAVQRFYLGIFGFLAFPIFILLLLKGVLILISRKLNISPILNYFILSCFFVLNLMLLIQMLITKSHINLTFNEYINYCYNQGQSFSTATLGGCLLGCICYPITSVMSIKGSILVYSIIMFLCLFLLFREPLYLLISGEYKRINRENERFYNAVTKINNSQPNDNGRKIDVVGNDKFQFKTKRQIKKAKTQSSNYNLFFGGNNKGANSTNVSNGFNNSNGIKSGETYGDSYVKEFGDKTQFTRRAYNGSSNSNDYLRNDFSVNNNGARATYSQMAEDIDESTYNKDTYVIDNSNRANKTIASFERQAGRNAVDPLQDRADARDVLFGDSRQDDINATNSSERQNYYGDDYKVNQSERDSDRQMLFGDRPNNSLQDQRQNDRQTLFGGNRDTNANTRQVDLSSERQRDRQTLFGNSNNTINNDFTTERPIHNGRYVDEKQDSFDFGDSKWQSQDAVEQDSLFSGTLGSRSSSTSSEVIKNVGNFSSSRDFSSNFSQDEIVKKDFNNSNFNNNVKSASDIISSIPDGYSNGDKTAGNISGKQLSMDNLSNERKLENPIDTMPSNYKFNFPPLDLMLDYKLDNATIEKNKIEQSKRQEKIITILKTANIEATMVDIKYGPTLTRFEFTIPPNVSIKKVLEKQDDLNLWLEASGKIRFVAPIVGTNRIGLEVPNKVGETVGLKSIISSKEFINAKKSSLSFCLGKDLIGNPVILDIAKMPHLLVAGATGTGKSVFLNSLLISLMYKYSPSELRLIIVDPKVVEFAMFMNLPHLLFNEVFNDTQKACAMLDWAVNEMEKRYKMLSSVLVKTIDEYNTYMAEKHGKKMPKILIIIDEFADLMASSKDKKQIEERIGRLAQKARAAGIHLIMATQRPSVDIMEGSIKTNFTSRIAFKMASSTDAQVIMNEIGAEKLLGKGDVLYKTSNMGTTERAQGAFIDTPEIDKICKYIKNNNKCYYDEFALEEINKAFTQSEAAMTDGLSNIEQEGSSVPKNNDEEIIKRALRIAILAKNVSISLLQRKLGLGYPKAGKIIDQMVEKKFISESYDNKARQVYITKEQFEQMYNESL